MGKEVTLRRRRTAVTHIVGGGGASEETPQKAPFFPPHTLSQLCAAGAGTGPCWPTLG